jgi:hypothetical protein
MKSQIMLMPDNLVIALGMGVMRSTSELVLVLPPLLILRIAAFLPIGEDPQHPLQFGRGILTG